MADEILWRAAIHPRRAAGSLTPAERRTVWRECRHVCRLALDTIAGQGDNLPHDLNVNIPETWLFRHRWRAGGHCPRTGVPLVREEIGGRTTCWSPARQKPTPVPESKHPRTSRRVSAQPTTRRK
jgi:formamidopyrimidine-DNA glycosylase